MHGTDRHRAQQSALFQRGVLIRPFQHPGFAVALRPGGVVYQPVEPGVGHLYRDRIFTIPDAVRYIQAVRRRPERADELSVDIDFGDALHVSQVEDVMPVFFYRPDFERGVVFGRSGEGFALGGNIQVFPRFQIDQFDRSRRSPAFREFEFPRGGQGLGRYDFWRFDPGSLRTVLSEDDEAGTRRGQVDADARPVVFRLGGYVADGSAYRIPQLYPSATPEVHRPPETFSLGRADVIPVGPVGRPVQPQDFRRIYVRFDRQSFQRVVQRYAGDDPAFSHVADAGSGVAPDFRCGRIQPFSGFVSADQRGRTLRGVSDDGRAVVYERIQLFGGLGQNFMNPALAARCFLMISFAGKMTDFAVSDSFRGVVDTVSGATPLAALKQNGFTDSSVSVLHMFIGDIQGTIGETSALAILIGAAILLVFKVIDLKIPLTYIGSFAVFVILYMLGTGKGFDVNYLFSHIFGGGLMLGAWFMATDYVTTPITPRGQYVYGVCLGVLTAVFRLFGGSAEGVSYAIIFCNLLVPMIERVTRHPAFGKGGKKA